MLNIKLNHDTELKLLEKEDAHELFSLTDKNRQYLRRWLPWLDDTNSVEDSLNFIQSGKEKFEGNKAFEAGIWYKGKLAGVIGLHEINWEEETTAIGYWVGEEYQGLGLVTMACKAVTDYVFNKLKLKELHICCAVENKKSRSIPQKLGFREEGIKELAECLYGTFVDHMVYIMTKNDFNKGDNSV